MARGRRRRVKEKMRRKREEVAARKVVVSRLILIYLYVVPVYVLKMVIILIPISLSFTQAVLEESLSRGGELLSESRQRIVAMEVSCFHYSHCTVAPHGNY